jgi:hypothetical protein
MNADTRKELIRLIERMSDEHPNWRLGQMIINLAGLTNAEVWDVEDEELLESAKTHLDNVAARNAHALVDAA